jgi:hypothetical protein
MVTQTNNPTEPSVITRRAFVTGLLVAPLLPSVSFGQDAAEPGTQVKLRITFASEDFTVTLEDHASAREFASMLPLELTISDYGSNEKIAYLPSKLTELVRGPFPNAQPSDLCYYVPWGNLAFFHRRYESTPDLVRLGRLDGGLAPLLTRGEFPLRIELAS